MELVDVKGIKCNFENLISSFWGVGCYINDINGEFSQMVGFIMEKVKNYMVFVLEEVN